MTQRYDRSAIEETQPGYPPLPRIHDRRWQPMIVNERSRHSAELCSLPRLKANHPLLTVYVGDCIEIIQQVRYGVWIAAKVEQQVGWLNTIHLDFVPVQEEAADENDDDEDTVVAHEVSSEFMSRMREIGVFEDKNTVPKRAVTDDDDDEDDIMLTKGEVNRIIGYLKGIANTLKRARDRSKS